MEKNPETTILKIKIPQQLKDDFRTLCHIQDCTMTTAVIELLNNACQQRMEDISEIKARRQKNR